MDVQQKLEILADAAKYDASCASSGTAKKNSLGSAKGIGSTEGMGICHAYAPDRRCISLLKIQLDKMVTNLRFSLVPPLSLEEVPDLEHHITTQVLMCPSPNRLTQHHSSPASVLYLQMHPTLTHPRRFS